MKRIRIVSGGTVHDTRISDADTGEEIRCVTEVEILPIRVGGGFVAARLTFTNVLLDVVADVEETPPEKSPS